MNNLKTIQKFSRTLKNIQDQQDVFQESRLMLIQGQSLRTPGSLTLHLKLYATDCLTIFGHCLVQHYFSPSD